MEYLKELQDEWKTIEKWLNGDSDKIFRAFDTGRYTEHNVLLAASKHDGLLTITQLAEEYSTLIGGDGEKRHVKDALEKELLELK